MVHKRRIPLVGVHVDTPDWLGDPVGFERPVVGYDGTNPAWVEDCCAGGTIFDPGGCVEAGATGGALTLVTTTHYHENHAGPPPGEMTGMTSGGSDSHTYDVGSTPATHNEPWTSVPAWTGCGGVGTGAFYNARHTGLWAHWTVASRPANVRAALRVTVECTHHSFTPRDIGIVASYHAPAHALDGVLLSKVSLGLGLFSAIVPASFIPAVGGHLWVGIVPLSQSPEGVADCNPSDWPYNTEFGDAYRSNWDFEATQWVIPCDVPVGSAFYGLDVGIGNGVEDTFVGWSTLAGSSQWYVDGSLTPPQSYDNVSGEAVFDRPVPIGAYVVQQGVSL